MALFSSQIKNSSQFVESYKSNSSFSIEILSENLKEANKKYMFFSKKCRHSTKLGGCGGNHSHQIQ